MDIRLFGVKYPVILLRGALFLGILSILLNSAGYDAFSETVPLDIYLCIDLSDSVPRNPNRELIRTLKWIFGNCLKDGPDGDRLAVILFAANSGVYRELQIMETSDFYPKGAEPRMRVLSELETTIGKKTIKFQDKRSNKDISINTKETRFRETNLHSFVQTDTDFQPRELASRRSVVMFLTDGEEDSDYGTRPETEIPSIRNFADMFYIGPQNDLVKSVRFVFFIVSHSRKVKPDDVADAWRGVFEPHFANFRYCVLSQLFGTSKDGFGAKITEVFDWLRHSSAIAFYVEKPLTYTPDTATIGPLVLGYASNLKEGKFVKIELESLDLSGVLPFGIHFPGRGNSQTIWIGGTEGLFPCASLHMVLDIETSGLVPEFRPNQKFRLKLSSEDAEAEVALNPKAIIVPIDEEPLKFDIDYDYQHAVSMSKIKKEKYQKLNFSISQTSSVYQPIFCYYRPPRNGDERQRIVNIKGTAGGQTSDIESHGPSEEDGLQTPCRVPPNSQLMPYTLEFELPGEKHQLYGGTIYFARFPGPPPYIPIKKKTMFPFLYHFTAPTTDKMEFTILVETWWNHLGGYVQKILKVVLIVLIFCSMFWFLLRLSRRLRAALLRVYRKHRGRLSSWWKFAWTSFILAMVHPRNIIKSRVIIQGNVGSSFFQPMWSGFWRLLSQFCLIRRTGREIYGWVMLWLGIFLFLTGYLRYHYDDWYRLPRLHLYFAFPRELDFFGLVIVVVALFYILEPIQKRRPSHGAIPTPAPSLTMAAITGVFFLGFLRTTIFTIITGVASFLAKQYYEHHR